METPLGWNEIRYHRMMTNTYKRWKRDIELQEFLSIHQLNGYKVGTDMESFISHRRKLRMYMVESLFSNGTLE